MIHQSIPHQKPKGKKKKEAREVRHGKKPTRKQKIRLGKAGLSPDNWLVIKEKRNGELVVLHKNTNTIRVVPASVG